MKTGVPIHDLKMAPSRFPPFKQKIKIRSTIGICKSRTSTIKFSNVATGRKPVVSNFFNQGDELNVGLLHSQIRADSDGPTFTIASASSETPPVNEYQRRKLREEKVWENGRGELRSKFIETFILPKDAVCRNCFETSGKRQGAVCCCNVLQSYIVVQICFICWKYGRYI